MKKIFKNVNYNEINIIKNITTHILLSFNFYNGKNIIVICNDENSFSATFSRPDKFDDEPHEINVPDTIFEYEESDVYKKVAQNEYDFLSYILPPDKLQVGYWIMSFLHELGHIYFWNMYYQQDKFDQYNDICSTTHFSLANINNVSMFARDIINNPDTEYVYRTEMCYKNNLKESNAWNFAYVHFPRIWQMLKIRGLV